MPSLASVSSLETPPASVAPACERFWPPLAPARRTAYARRIGPAIAERAREMAVLESLDNGEPIKESRDFDVPQAAAHFFDHAGWADKLAYAAGNTIVLKPAETTPLSALRLAEICADADLPPGVVNIVTGDGATGAGLVAHPGVDNVAHRLRAGVVWCFGGYRESGFGREGGLAGLRPYLRLGETAT